MAEATGSKLDLGRLVEDLKEVTEWFQLGLRLGIKHADLKKIELNHKDIERCKTEMIAFWQNNCRNATLRKLITALEEIDLRNLAKRLREKYNVPQTDNINGNVETQVMEPDELLNPSSDDSKLRRTKCMINQLDKEVRREYAKFAIDLQSLLERKGVSVNDAIYAFAYYEDESAITSDMREATNIQAFLLALKHTQSWYNFDTTATLADLLCGDEGKKLVETYETKLKVNLKKRRKAFKIQSREFVVKVNEEREQFTKKKIDKFRSTVVKLMNLKKKDLVLRSVKDGCVELTFLFLSTFAPTIKSAIGACINEFKEQRVISVSIDGEVVWSQPKQSGSLKGETMITKPKRLSNLPDMHAIGSKMNVPKRLKTRSVPFGDHDGKRKQPYHKLILETCRSGMKRNRKRLILIAAIVVVLLLVYFVIYFTQMPVINF